MEDDFEKEFIHKLGEFKLMKEIYIIRSIEYSTSKYGIIQPGEIKRSLPQDMINKIAYFAAKDYDENPKLQHLRDVDNKNSTPPTPES